MADTRYNLIKDLEILLKSEIDDEDMDALIDRISYLLENYEISDRVRSLVTYEDENLKIIDRYKACLAVEGKSLGTIEQYKYRLNHMVKTMKIHLKDMGPYDIRFYLAILKKQGCSNRTLDTCRTYINTFFKWMVNEELIDKNPCASIKSIKYTLDIKEPFSDLDIEKIRYNCRDVRERSMVELLLSSGVRVSELENLDVYDVDFKDHTVRVRHGKGDKERITYMSEIAAYYLGLYLNTRDDKYVELYRSEKGRLTDGGVRYILHDIGDRAQVDDVHPHRFRRTFATNLYNKGMSIQNIQQLMGHTKIDTTMIYIRINQNAVRSEYLRCTQ